MNKVLIAGRLTRDPMVKYTQTQEPMAVARYTLAVDRPRRQGQEQQADFISCVAFGRLGEFAEKYLTKGTKILVEGHIQTGSYEKNGEKVYTTDVIVEHQEFCEGKKEGQKVEEKPNAEGFMRVPESIEEELPFH